MNRYRFAYRVGFRPWEAYATAATDSTGALLDREESQREGPPGRALDLGCGRGLYTCELARRGWQAVGIDFVPRAIQAADCRGNSGARFVLGDVTDLAASDLGTFDFFLDIGCFQGMNRGQRLAAGRGVSAAANPGATLLILAFQPTRWQTATGAVSSADIQAAFPGWQMLSVERANTTGLGWPLTKTSPTWYRLRTLIQAPSLLAPAPGESHDRSTECHSRGGVQHRD
jgi:SAM-dependent methyltransferase